MRGRRLELWITVALPSCADILCDMQWAKIAQRQAGVITREQARSAGLTDRQVTSLTRSGMWQPTPRQGVFTVASAPWTPERPLWVTALATGGVISHLSAAQLWQLELPTEPRTVHVTIPAEARRRPLAGVVMTRADLSTSERGERFGLAVTSLRRTILDCLATVSLTDARTMADRCLQRRLITTEGIVSHLELLPNRPGNGQLRRLLAEVDGAAAASERVLHQLLRQVRCFRLATEPHRRTWDCALRDRCGVPALEAGCRGGWLGIPFRRGPLPRRSP